MLAPHGLLVTHVTHKKQTYRTYLGVDASAVNLLRPAMYGAYHHITNLDRPDEETEIVDIVGSLCENNDKFAKNREFPVSEIGDLLVIHDTGAHGYSMGYQYNAKLRSAEILLEESGQNSSHSTGRKTRGLLCNIVWLLNFEKIGAFFGIIEKMCKILNLGEKTLMSTFLTIFIDYPCFSLVEMLAGMYLLRKQFEKEFASNPRLNVEAVRTLLGASGQRPSEAKVQQVYRQILNQQKASLNTKKK